MREQVAHTGKVVSMTPQTTTVQIVSHAACSECHAAGVCGLSEYTEKAIEVPTRPTATYGVGDEVQVVLKATMGLKAVWLAYFLPLVVLLAVALGLIALGLSEVVAGLAGLGAVALYYGILWLLRDRLRNEYVFTIQDKP
jgi:sigma-E factor negative regulatory protein RseC